MPNPHSANAAPEASPASTEGRAVEPIAKGSRTIQSVDRALKLLDILADAESELALNEIAKRAGLNNSTCHHLLATLMQHQFLGRSDNSRGYFLGPKITELSERRLRQFNLLDFAQPKIRELNALTRECVHLATLQGTALVTLAKLESKLPVGAGFDDSMKVDASHATATGKAILAWLPEAQIARVIAQSGFRAFTDKTCTSLSDFLEELRMVRRNGYSVDNEEFQPGVYCIGAAIRNQTGAVVGSVSTSIPRLRAEGKHLELVKQNVIKTANEISIRFGNSNSNDFALQE